jgi:hypothetical protein
MSPPDEPLDRLHRDLGLNRLNPLWAKLEIFLDLIAVAAGLLGGMSLAAHEARSGDAQIWAAWAGQAALIVFGGYLTLAGHRSHLYQSNNRLAAHLADLIRKTHTNTPQSEKAP